MILINNDLIWVSVPRCASFSIEGKLFNSGLNIKYADDEYVRHQHKRLDALYSYFGHKESVCITRDWFDRWLSGIRHVWQCILDDGLTSIVNFENIDNDFIYNNFDVEFLKKLYLSEDDIFECYFKLVKEDINHSTAKKTKLFTSLMMLMNQKYWKCNETCTYEFDITELDKFEKFIENRYNIDFKLEKLNVSEKINNKIVVDEKLKDWVWEIFELTPFKKNKTIL